jgi:hypothetical protein
LERLVPGNVGIGTTSPDSILHVKNGDAGVTPYSLGTGLNIEGTTSTVGINIISSDTAQGRIYFASPSSNTAGAIEYNHNASLSSGFMKFRTGNSERMRITGDGNVGIGTTSPNYKLAVYGSSTDSEIVASFGSANDVYEYTAIGLSGFIASNGATKAGLALKRTSTYGTGELHFLNNNTLDNSDMNLSDSKMMINSSGNVGIGTTSPQSKLQVAGGVQMADDTDAASADKVGTLRYRTSGNNSYVDMCMQTGATTYEWVNIVQNNW